MDTVIIRELGVQPYATTLHLMQRFTDHRQSDTLDEIWLLEHPPVFTQGQAGKAEHLLVTSNIPVIQADRGGQITYHGPGQLICYLLLDIKRKRIGARELVTRLETALIDNLAKLAIDAFAKADAPGVYTDQGKIASLGLRIRKGRSFHGLALNIDMDLSPFQQINPCGYAGMAMTQVSAYLPQQDGKADWEKIQQQLVTELLLKLGYNDSKLLYNLPTDEGLLTAKNSLDI